MNCTAVLVLEGMHYKAWLLRNGSWVEADSLTCASSALYYASVPFQARPCIRVLREADWAALGDRPSTVCIYALVRLDAFIAGLTVWPSPCGIITAVVPRNLTCVDVAALHVSDDVQRLPYNFSWLPVPVPAVDGPRPAKTPRRVAHVHAAPADAALALVQGLLGEPCPTDDVQGWAPPPHALQDTVACALLFKSTLK